jgi:four helix bundle protein
VQFLFRARGSLLELETQITIGQELGYVELEDGKRLINLAAEVGRMLNGMVNTFQTLINSEPQPKT